MSSVSLLRGKLFKSSKQEDETIKTAESERTLRPVQKDQAVKKLLVYDNNTIFSCHDNRIIRMWDMKSGEIIHVLEVDHTPRVLEIYDDILYFANSKTDNYIRAWDIRSQQLVGVMKGHSSWVSRILIHGGVLYSSSADKDIRAWDIYTTLHDKQSERKDGVIEIPCIAIFQGHTDTVTCLETNKENLISGATDHTIRVWTLKSKFYQEVNLPLCERELTGHKDMIFGIKMHNGTLLSASIDHTIRTWNIQNGKCLQVFDLGTLVTDMRVDLRIIFDDHIFVTSADDYTIHMFNLKTGKIVKTMYGHTNEIKTLQMSSTHLFSGSSDRTIRKWDIKTGTCTLILKGHIDIVNSMVFFDGSLYSASEDGTMKEWNALQEDKPITLTSVSLNTKHLDLSHTKITQLPDYITKLQNLDILYMNNNHFHDLPQGVQRLTTLKALNLDYNLLRQFPASVANLHNLKQLYLEHNELAHIPRTIVEKLVHLEMLYLGHNKLTELPPNLVMMTKLTRLCVNDNMLTSLPLLGKITNLEILKIENNGLVSIPLNLIELTKLRVLSLKNNPWAMPEEAIRDISSLFDYLRGKIAETSKEMEIDDHDPMIPLTNHDKLRLPTKRTGPVSRRPMTKVMTLKRKPLPAPPPMGSKPLPKLPDTPKVVKPLPPPPPSVDDKMPRKSISMPDVGIPEGAEIIPPPVIAMTTSLDKLPPPPPHIARPPRPPPPKAKSVNLVNPADIRALSPSTPPKVVSFDHTNSFVMGTSPVQRMEHDMRINRTVSESRLSYDKRPMLGRSRSDPINDVTGSSPPAKMTRPPPPPPKKALPGTPPPPPPPSRPTPPTPPQQH